MSRLFFTLGGLFTFAVGVFLILRGVYIGGLFQLCLAAGFPLLYEASKP